MNASFLSQDAPGISSATLSRKLIVLKTERQQTAKEIPDYYQIRESTRRTLVEEAGRLSRSSESFAMFLRIFSSQKLAFDFSPGIFIRFNYRAPCVGYSKALSVSGTIRSNRLLHCAKFVRILLINIT